ncbi:MAG: ComF family protein [Calditrichaceae bacterium]
MNISKFYDFFIEPVIAFALPAFCISCESKLTDGRKVICPDCFNKLPLLPEEYIDVLYKEIEQPYFDDLIIRYQFAELFQKLIHQFKYQRILSLAKYFAAAIAPIIKGDNCDYIVCVPLNAIKEKERGYNQSALIAEEIGNQLNITINNELIGRIKNTPSQTKLNREQRILNMQDAFICEENLKDKHIIVVDDIITTGSTLNACAKVLKNNGANKVTAVALATPMDILQHNLEKELIELNSF